MFTHVIMLSLDAAAGPEAVRAVVEGLHGLAGQVPGLASVRTGQDLGLAAGNADVVALLEFESEASWRAYGEHPAHRSLVSEVIAPVLVSKAAIQVSALNEAPG